MPQALCENDHPLVTGESRCPECGERIKMQWMSPRAVRDGTSTRAQPKSDVMSGGRFAVLLLLLSFNGVLFVYAHWDGGLKPWEWAVSVLGLGVGIPYVTWEWRRDVGKAQAAEQAA